MTVHITPRRPNRWHSLWRFAWRVMVEPRDVWVGVFWERKRVSTEFYVCVVPCVVLHVAYYTPAPAPAGGERAENMKGDTE